MHQSIRDGTGRQTSNCIRSHICCVTAVGLPMYTHTHHTARYRYATSWNDLTDSGSHEPRWAFEISHGPRPLMANCLARAVSVQTTARRHTHVPASPNGTSSAKNVGLPTMAADKDNATSSACE